MSKRKLDTGPASSFGHYQAPKIKKTKKEKKVFSFGGKVTNFYDICNKEKEFQTKKVEYPNEEKIKIDVPFMMSLSGKTGSGKTNVAIDILTQINIFDKIYLCVKDPDEPLYKWLAAKIMQVEKKTGANILKVISDIAQIPVLEDINRELNNLFIFDDLITEKDKLLKRVEKYYIAGRKRNCSCMFLSQSYYSIPKVIRKNCMEIILKHINQSTDLKRILADYAEMDVTLEKLTEMYHAAIAGDPFNFFMIDLKTMDDNLKFRVNYTGIPASEWKANNTDNSNSNTNTININGSTSHSSSSIKKDDQ